MNPPKHSAVPLRVLCCAAAYLSGCGYAIHFHCGDVEFGRKIQNDDRACERDGDTLALHLTAGCYVDHDLWIQIEDYDTGEVLCSSAESGDKHCALQRPIPKARLGEAATPVKPVPVHAPVPGLTSHERRILVQISGNCSDGRTRAAGSLRCRVRRAK